MTITLNIQRQTRSGAAILWGFNEAIWQSLAAMFMCINFWYLQSSSFDGSVRFGLCHKEDLHLFAVDNNPQGEEGRHLLSEVVEVIK